MRHRRTPRGVQWLTGGILATVLVAGISMAAPAARTVQMKAIVIPAAAVEPDAEAPAPEAKVLPPGVAQPAPADMPPIEYDVSKLPTAVRRLREQIIEAAATGDPEQLRPIIDANGEPPMFSFDDEPDPIAYLKSLSGDEGGREILAILIEVLEAGYVHVDVGTPDEMYVWPYFARYPVDNLTPRQLVELFKLVYAGDYEDMLAYGHYTWFRAGIAPDGTWRYFISD